MDVDGVLTDGQISLTSAGDEVKSFHVADGLGLTLLRLAGIKTAWITGRRSTIVEHRASELSIEYVYQGVRDKGTALHEISQNAGVPFDRIAYIGDDLNDLTAFECVTYSIAVADARDPILRAAALIAEKPGGHGAVREVADFLLHQRGQTEEIMNIYLQQLRSQSTLSGQHHLNSGSGQ